MSSSSHSQFSLCCAPLADCGLRAHPSPGPCPKCPLTCNVGRAPARGAPAPSSERKETRKKRQTRKGSGVSCWALGERGARKATLARVPRRSEAMPHIHLFPPRHCFPLHLYVPLQRS